jgi:hypothetical protein
MRRLRISSWSDVRQSLAGGSSGAACFFVERFMRDWGDFLESSGGAGNEKDARQVSGVFVERKNFPHKCDGHASWCLL